MRVAMENGQELTLDQVYFVLGTRRNLLSVELLIYMGILQVSQVEHGRLYVVQDSLPLKSSSC